MCPLGIEITEKVQIGDINTWMVPTNIYFYLQEEVHRYLRVTHSTLEIDFFNFEWYVHVFNHFTPERKFYKIDDISYGKENAPVSCVNSLDNNYPEYVRTHHMFSRILNFLFVIVFSRERERKKIVSLIKKNNSYIGVL